VTAVQRNVGKYLKATASKRLSKEEIAKVYGKLSEKTTLITDKHPSYRAFSKVNPTIKSAAGKGAC